MKYALTFLLLFVLRTAICQEVIPFELKEDHRMYLKVSVNQSDTLNFVFDLGANITVINKTRLQQNQLKMEFSGTVENGGTNGVSNEQISHDNSVQMGGEVYDDVDILGISYAENRTLDGIIGWNLFKNKVVRIDYESRELVVYDNLPKLSDTYTKTKLKFIRDLPYAQTTIYRNGKKVKIWAMLDSGYNGEFHVYSQEVAKHNLLVQYQVIGEATTSGTDGNVSKADVVLLPRFSISGFEIYNMPANLTKTPTESTKPALLGGNLLKRFHIVLDFKNQEAYLKPNILINSPF